MVLFEIVTSNTVFVYNPMQIGTGSLLHIITDLAYIKLVQIYS